MAYNLVARLSVQDKMSAKIQRVTRHTEKFRKATEQTNKTMNKLSAIASSTAAKISRDFKKAYEDAKPDSFFDAANSAGKKLTALGVAGAGVLGGAIKTAVGFEKQMSRVASLSGATGEELKKLTKTARDLGAKTAFSAVEAAQGMEYLALAGYDTNQTISAMPGMLNLAAAGALELGEAADIVSDTMSAFRMAAEQAGQAADVFAYAQANANTNVSMLGEAFSYVAPAAAAAGMDLEQTTAILSKLADNAIKGSRGGTVLEAMLRDVRKSAQKGAVTIGQAAISVYDATGKMRDMTSIMADIEKATKGMTDTQRDAALGSIFQQEAMRGVNILLTEGADSVKAFETELYNSAGFAAKVAEQMQDNVAGAFVKLGSAAAEAAITVGDVFKDDVRKAAEWVNTLVDKFNALPESTQRTIATVAAVATAFALIGGPVLLVISLIPNMAAGFVTLGKGALLLGKGLMFMMSPIGLTIAAIGLLAFVVYKNWDKIKMKTEELIISLGEKFTALINWFKALPERIGAVVSAIGQWFTERLPYLIGYGIGFVISYLSTLPERVSNFMTRVPGIITTFFSTAKERALTMSSQMVEGVISFIATLPERIGAFFSEVVTKVSEGAQSAYEAAIDWFKQIPEKIQEFLTGAVDGVLGFINRITTAFGGGFKEGSNKGKAAGTHYHGLDRVPYDGYMARLHKGETVLPRPAAEVYRQSGLGGNVVDLMPRLAERAQQVSNRVNNTEYRNEYNEIQYVSHAMPRITSQGNDNAGSAGRGADGSGQEKGGDVTVTIAKIADSVVIREESDIEKVANTLAIKVYQARMAGA